MIRLRRAAAALLAVTAAAWAAAESWTVQTVAMRDLREATSVADDLRRLGFDAYTEFTMANRLQYVRVRVGCFHARDGAEAMAALLRGWATRDAVVVERTPGAPARGCLLRDVGFVAPEDGWRQRAPGVASFEVEVAGVTGLVRYRGGRWQVLQAAADDALPIAVSTERRFVQVDAAPRPFVAIRDPDGPLLVCAGRLLAESDGAAIVEQDGVVSACRFVRPDGEAEP